MRGVLWHRVLCMLCVYVSVCVCVRVAVGLWESSITGAGAGGCLVGENFADRNVSLHKVTELCY